jgi:hypothetical protein
MLEHFFVLLLFKRDLASKQQTHQEHTLNTKGARAYFVKISYKSMP